MAHRHPKRRLGELGAEHDLITESHDHSAGFAPSVARLERGDELVEQGVRRKKSYDTSSVMTFTTPAVTSDGSARYSTCTMSEHLARARAPTDVAAGPARRRWRVVFRSAGEIRKPYPVETGWAGEHVFGASLPDELMARVSPAITLDCGRNKDESTEPRVLKSFSLSRTASSARSTRSMSGALRL